MIGGILKQQKRPHKTIEVDPYNQAGVPPPRKQREVHPGDRPDNEWILYREKAVPTTQEAWDETMFVEKTHWGFYTWPKYTQSLNGT